MPIRRLLLAFLLVSGVAHAQGTAPTTAPTGTTAPRPAMPAPRAATPAAASPTPAAATPAATTAAPAHPRKTLAERFQAANTTHDGKLTLEQARAGRLRAVVRDFDQIDTGKHGYVTLDEIKAHQAAQRAARRAARTAKPAATPATH